MGNTASYVGQAPPVAVYRLQPGAQCGGNQLGLMVMGVDQAFKAGIAAKVVADQGSLQVGEAGDVDTLQGTVCVSLGRQLDWQCAFRQLRQVDGCFKQNKALADQLQVDLEKHLIFFQGIKDNLAHTCCRLHQDVGIAGQ